MNSDGRAVHRSKWGLGCMQALLALAGLLGAVASDAAQVVRFTPQGVVARVSQVQVDFDGPVVALGDDLAPAPYQIQCDGGAPQGSGHWADPQHWVYRFDQALQGAIACKATPEPAFRDLQGQPISRASVHTFTTGGPRARLASPWDDTIAEDQVFVLAFNAPSDPRSLLDHAHCEVQGLGEAVPVRLIEGAPRDQILHATAWDERDARRADARLLQCKRLLPAGARVRLVVGPGVAAPAQGTQAAIAGQAVLTRDFKVRPAFHADLSCTRTHAQAPCSPLFPIRVDFSSPVPPAQAARVSLQAPGGARLQARELEPDARNSRGDTAGNALSSLSFAPPFAEKTVLRLAVPADLQDDAGRTLDNAARFPIEVELDALPPLVKFASGPFGIIERFAQGPAAQPQTATVPLAVRRVGPALRTQALTLSAGTVNDHVTTDDVQALQWYVKVGRSQDGTLTSGQWSDVLASRPLREWRREDPEVDVRSRSLFGPGDTTRTLTLPGLPAVQAADIEMIGIPVTKPGLHVIEIASPRLGAALLAKPPHAASPTLYVRSAVLVTNLAVHVKTGRDDVLVWVTALDSGEPVADAHVRVLDCRGEPLRDGRTGRDGVWHSLGAPAAAGYCEETGQSGLFVTARVAPDNPAAHGQADFSFAWTSWDRGIEPWRFDVPFDASPTPDWVAHAVLDRSLLHTGETVSMKLFLRELQRAGVGNPKTDCASDAFAACLPTKVEIEHEGSEDRVELPVAWKRSPTGGLYALLDYAIPETAHLGRYRVRLPMSTAGDTGRWAPALDAGHFTVAAFRLPVLTGSLKVSNAAADSPPAPAGHGLIDPAGVRADLQLAWQSGGPAGDLDATLSAVAQPYFPQFADYDQFTFGVPDDLQPAADGDEGREAAGDTLRRLILDKRAVKLDARGGAQVTLTDLPSADAAQTWHFEASFADPNGAIQTLSQDVRVWPSSVVVGLQSGSWPARGELTPIKLLAVDTQGRPQADVPVSLEARVRTRYSVRKRLVGGFYAYDSHDRVEPLGRLCEGRTNAQGLLECRVRLERDGEIQLFATARDARGRVSRAASSVWVWGDEAWFGAGDDDRIDVIPDKTHYEPSETARLTVRMPFRRAQALVAIEREGVLETRVLELHGDEPVVRLPIEARWGPNVFVSVLVVRGRVRRVPWSSFLSWGWRHPVDWAHAHAQAVDDAPEPTGLVDLAKPSFRFGLTQLRIHDDSDRLQVAVEADRTTYQVRDRVGVRIQATLPDGQPAAGASVAFAAVDEALLDLMPNASWDLLAAMRVMRPYGVRTASSQGEVVGRRHYGRKAVPVGGGGGIAPTRELFDTLLLWRGDLTLDAQGRAQLDVPLNDALTRFRLVAVVDYGQDAFGTGTTDVVSTQALQVISGLPPLVREGDRYQARVTVRNRTAAELPLELSASAQRGEGAVRHLSGKTLNLPAGASRTLAWPVTAPALAGDAPSETLQWVFSARVRPTAEAGDAESGSPPSDQVRVRQEVQPAVPVTVRQATLLPVRDGSPQRVPVGVSDAALRDAQGKVRGGVRVTLQSRLGGTLPGVRDWLEAYPYTCVEQLSAKAIGLQDRAAWAALMKRLPAYETASGLVSYFPGGQQGSVALTAQLIEVTERAKALGWPYVLPEPARARMLNALQDYVFGRLTTDAWAPMDDRFWRKLVAVNALALAGAWQPGMLDSFTQDVSDWPTPAVVTWLSLLVQLPEISGQHALIARAETILRARLARHGTTLVLSDATAGDGWWLMSNVAAAQARLLMTALARPEWRADWGPLMQGLLSLQSRGAWPTTTANVLGVLATSAYAQHAERDAGQGAVRVALRAQNAEAGELAPGSVAPKALPWVQMPLVDGIHRQTLDLAWPPAGSGAVTLAQEGAGGGWATVTARAAQVPAEAVNAGMRLDRTVMPVVQRHPGRWSPGDVYRVRLRIHTQEPVVWSVISDPVPAGASILGDGLGRDSQIATQGESAGLRGWDRPSFVERHDGLYRAYFERMRAGTQTLEYTVRINTPGDFQLPPTRAEALYQPDVFGSLPNAAFHVDAGE